jgi:hypothetical protein
MIAIDVYSTNDSLFEVNEVLVGGSWPSWSPAVRLLISMNLATNLI